MRKLLAYIIAFALSVSTAGADILIYEDFEDSLNTTYWKISNCTLADNAGEISSTLDAYNGSSYWRAYVQPYEITENGATNCSIGPQNYAWMGGTNNFEFDTEYWVGYAIRVASSTSYPDSSINPDGGGIEWQLWDQMHGIIEACDDINLNPNMAIMPLRVTPAQDTATITFGLKGDDAECVDKSNLDVSTTQTLTTGFTKGVWHIVVYNFLFDYTSGGNGFWKVWIDGVQVLDWSGQNAYNHAKAPYWMLGPYGHMHDAIEIHYDEVRVGDANSSYAEVLPQGGGADDDPPIISAGSPSGTLTAGTTSTTISCTTSENATCKYDTNNVSYASMTNTFSTT